jgi:hypothetical protein
MADDIEILNEADELADQRDLAEWRIAAGGLDLLGRIDPERPIPWIPGAERIIKRGERQTWVANFGEGKTQAAVMLAAQVCEAGGRVAYVDVENDEEEMAERFQPIFDAWGAWDAWRLRGTYLPRLNLALVLQSDELIESWVKAVWPVDLLILDSWTRILGQFDLDENSNRDITRFMHLMVDPLKDKGKAIVILDNTGNDGKRNRGAVSKVATVEAAYKVSGGKAITPTKHGELKLTKTRSRSGRIAQVVKGAAGDGEFVRLTAAETEQQDSKVEGRRLLVKQMLYDRRDEEFTTDQVAAAVGSHPKTVGRDLSALESDGTVALRKEGNTRLWSAVSQ